MTELTDVLIDLYAMESASAFDLDDYDYAFEADEEAAKSEPAKAEDKPASPEQKQGFFKKILAAIKKFFMKIGAIFSKKLSAKLLLEKIEKIPEGGIKFNKKMFVKALALQKKGYSECWDAINKQRASYTSDLKTAYYVSLSSDDDVTKMNAIDSHLKELKKVSTNAADYEKSSKKEIKAAAAAYAKLINQQIGEIKKEEAKEVADAKKAADTTKKQNIFVRILRKIWDAITFIPKMIGEGIKKLFGCIKKDGKAEEKKANESYLFY